MAGLSKGMQLMERLKQLQSRVLRQQKRLAVVFQAINDFKHVNDSDGHEFSG
jgi:PleD family two-component response regulator